MNRFQIIIVLVCCFILGLSGIGVVSARLGISSAAKECGMLEDKREVLLREVQELRGQRSWALRPTVLAEMVSGRLGMSQPAKTIYVSQQEISSRVGGVRGAYSDGETFGMNISQGSQR